MKKKTTGNRARVILFLIVAIAVVVAIIYAKLASERPITGTSGEPDSLSAPIAVPDTSTLHTDLPIEPETITVSLPDTLDRDTRPPYEAGYEDGYLNGMDDGAENKRNATYDETSHFPSQGERAGYVQGYRDGYAKGFDDGLNKRQFNIDVPTP